MRARRLSLLGAFALAALALGYAHLPKIWVAREERIARPQGYQFTGALPTYADDCFTYWSWMRQAREGKFFFEDLYTTEPHPRNYVNLLFWALGASAHVAGVSMHRTYAIARVLLAVGLLIALWRLAGRMFDIPYARLTAFAFFVVQGGWAGVADVFERHWQTAHVSSPEWWTPEMNTAYSMMLFPHFLAGFLCMVGIALFALDASRAKTTFAARAYASAAGVVMTLLTFFHPYDVVPMVTTLWLAPCVLALVEHRIPRREIETAAIATGVWAPALLYNAWIFSHNPAMRAWDLQNIMTTPEPSRLVIALGIGGLLAALAFLKIREMPRPILFAAAWFLAQLILIHVPLRFQRRMIGGIQFPMGALATYALAVWLAPFLSRVVARWSHAVTVRNAFGREPVGASVMLAALIIFPLEAAGPRRIIGLEWNELRRVRYPAWVRESEVDAFFDLDRIHDPHVVVLSSYEMGGLIPPWTGHFTYLGHYALTIDAQRKQDEIKRFFSADATDDPFRIDLCRNARVTHLFYGPHERELGAFDPASRPWLKEVIRTGTKPEDRVTVYEVDVGAMTAAAPASATPQP